MYLYIYMFSHTTTICEFINEYRLSVSVLGIHTDTRVCVRNAGCTIDVKIVFVDVFIYLYYHTTYFLCIYVFMLSPKV